MGDRSMTGERNPTTIPEDWTAPSWLTGPNYTKTELMYLAERLDASNRQLRIINQRLRTQLDRQETQP
jgi:hypothetical protein